MSKHKEMLSIKFYLDDKVNQSKKDKIMRFLTECQTIENKLLKYYWNNFGQVTSCEKWGDFYDNRITIKEPRTKFHHYQQILHMVYAQLKSLETRIRNSTYFKFEDKEQQALYNYLSNFCFQWNKMEKYIDKQLKEYKKTDRIYFEFLSKVKRLISDTEQYNKIKQEIENKFYEIKNNRFKQPVKKEFQIWLFQSHVIKEIQMKEFQWVFIVDNNDIIGGTDKKPVFDKMVIPVKYSDYHKKKLKDKVFNSTFTLKLNKYERIEIIAAYNIESKTIETQSVNPVGIDIGLNKLITTSDGEIIEQNHKIVRRLKNLVKKQSNRDTLQAYLKKKYNDDSFELPFKNYTKMQNRLIRYITCDNRHKVKKFLESHITDHIIIEDLDISYSCTKSREVNFLLKRMHIQQVKNYLVKYAKDLGIKVTEVNAAYTSQQCSNCGHTSKKNRKTQEKFSCVKCGFEANADWNASVNIKNRAEDKRIKLNTLVWRVREILSVG